jgi:sugar-specific transcriptional regulator TrmB
MSEGETIGHLQRLGLNLYESRAYLALLARKQLTAKSLGRSAMIPQSRTYDVLESLTEKGFAVTTPASPTTYTPVSPARVLGFYYNSEKKKIQERAARVGEEAQKKLEELRDTYVALTKDLPNITAEDTQPHEHVWVLRERENITSSMIGLIQDAKSELLRITKPPDPSSKLPFDPFYIVSTGRLKFVYDALDRGVKMRWLSLAREIPSFVGLVVDEPPERRYFERDDEINEKFFLVDSEAVLLNLHDPMSKAFGSVALMIQSKAASSIFLEHFEKMWERGKPLSDVLPKMKSLVEDVSTKLGELEFTRREILLFRTMAKFGANTRDVLVSEMAKRKIDTRDTLACLEKFMQMGLAHRDSTLKLFMLENPSNIRDSINEEKASLENRAVGYTTRRGRSSKNI